MLSNPHFVFIAYISHSKLKWFVFNIVFDFRTSTHREAKPGVITMVTIFI